MKGTLLPGGANGVQKFKGKIVSMTPETKPKQIVLALEQPNVPDVTLELSQALPGKMEAGEELQFEGVAKSYTKQPFMVVFESIRSRSTAGPARTPRQRSLRPAKAKAKAKAKRSASDGRGCLWTPALGILRRSTAHGLHLNSIALEGCCDIEISHADRRSRQLGLAWLSVGDWGRNRSRRRTPRRRPRSGRAKTATKRNFYDAFMRQGQDAKTRSTLSINGKRPFRTAITTTSARNPIWAPTKSAKHERARPSTRPLEILKTNPNHFFSISAAERGSCVKSEPLQRRPTWTTASRYPNTSWTTLDAVFAPANKPGTMNDTQWPQAKPVMPAAGTTPDLHGLRCAQGSIPRRRRS